MDQTVQVRIARHVAVVALVCSLLLAGAATGVEADGGVALSNCGVPPGAERCPRYESRYDGQTGGSDRAEAVVVSPDGSKVYVGGYASGSGLDILVAALDASTGALVWADERALSSGADRIADLALSPDGAVLYAHGDRDGDLLTIAYDAESGEALWQATHDGPGSGSDAGRAVDVSADGAMVYVGGYGDRVTGSTRHLDGLTVAYDAVNGTRLWAVSYDGPAGFWDVLTDQTAAVVTGTDGVDRELVIATMRSNVASSGNDHTDVATVAYDGATGARVWESFYDGPAGSREYPYAMTTSPDGTTVYVAAESQGLGSGFDYATIAYDTATGAQRWVARQDVQGGNDRALAIAASPDGATVFTSGMGSGDFGGIDRTADVVAYDAASGERRWLRRFDFEVGAAASALAVSPDSSRVYLTGLVVGQAVGGGIYLGGTPVGGGGYVTVNGILTVAYHSATGEQAWWARHADPGSGRDVAVSPDGATVFVVGGGADAVLVAYDS